MKQIYVCEDTITGLYSAIYDAWKESRIEDSNGIRIQGQFDREFFCEYQIVEASQQKALAVENMIKKHLGMEVYRDIYYALLSPDPDRADAALGVMQAARKLENPRKVMQYLGHRKVERVFALSRMVTNEVHSFTEFVRFRELQNGVLFSEITPKSQVLTCIADHFSDRFPLENWMIYDKVHQSCLIHEACKRWVLVHGEVPDVEIAGQISDAEHSYMNLWKMFCKTIAIEERKNLKLQRNHLPIHFRQDMVEFLKNNC